MLKGIDVSSFQGANPDLNGYDIIFIKATEALGYVNPDLKPVLEHCRKLGKRVGFYHYAWPVNGGGAEVQYMYDTLKDLLEPGDVVCLDWEFYGPAGQNLTFDRARAYKDEWFTAAAEIFKGHKAILYTNVDRWLHVDINSNCGDGLWIADYVAAGKPRIQHPWIGHQWTDSPVDQDVWNFKDLVTYDAWTGIVPRDIKVPIKIEPASWPLPKPTLPTVHVGHLIYSFHRDPQKKGSPKGPFAAEVLLMEQALCKTGWLDKRYVDGYYGTMTIGDGNVNGKGGVTGFQRKHSGAIHPDGWLGHKELDLLFKMAGMKVNVVD